MSLLEERDYLKKIIYRRIDERCEEFGLGRMCVLCHVRIPGGNGLASAHHEILPKSELRGRNNWDILFSFQNIALACTVHHDRLGHVRLVWMKGLVVAGLAQAEQYRVEPFDEYWQDAPYPPCGECIGRYGYGNQYFQTNEMPDSLVNLYTLDNPEFETQQFCMSCRVKRKCLVLMSSPSSIAVTVLGARTTN